MRWLPGTRILTEVVGGGLVVRGATKVRVSVARDRRDRTRRLAGRSGYDGGAEAELLEADTEVFEAAAHAGGEHPQVGTPDRQHAAVEVLALELDRRREPRQHLRVGIVDLVQTDQVDGEAVGLVDRARGAVDEADLAVELTGQQLVGRHFVDLGEPQQAGHGDGPLAPLVGTEDRRLELEGRACFDVVKRQALLTPNRSESLADACSRRRHLLSPLTRLFATCDATADGSRAAHAAASC